MIYLIYLRRLFHWFHQYLPRYNITRHFVSLLITGKLCVHIDFQKHCFKPLSRITVLIRFPKFFQSKMLFVRTVSILVFSRNSNRTMNYSLGTYFLTGKNIFPKLFLELHNDVLVMFLQYF